MDLEACLPASLRGPATTITRIAAGLSGAGVHRVEAAGQVFVLKLSGEDEPPEAWRRRLHVLRLAADADLAPRVVHADESRRAVLSAFVADRSFPAFHGDPRTREAALALLGGTVRRVHALPLPPDAPAADPRARLAGTWSRVGAGFPLPAFAADAVDRALSGGAPAPVGGAVLSHNDLNPSNLVFDGAKLLLVDWDAAGRNEPLYDLAVLAVFLRMDARACETLLAAYHGRPPSGVPGRFAYLRRLVAALVGATFLERARASGHPGAPADAALESTPSLAECYGEMRAGTLDLASGDGKLRFGLALLGESLAA